MIIVSVSSPYTHLHFLQPDDVTYMSDELGLHRVENTSHSYNAVSLHLYAPPFGSCQVITFNTPIFHNVIFETTLRTIIVKKKG